MIAYSRYWPFAGIVLLVAVLCLFCRSAPAQDASPRSSDYLTVRNWIGEPVDVRFISSQGVQTERIQKLRKLEAMIGYQPDLQAIEICQAGRTLRRIAIDDPALRVTGEPNHLFVFASPDGVLLGDTAANARPFRERIVEGPAIAWYVVASATFAFYLIRTRRSIAVAEYGDGVVASVSASPKAQGISVALFAMTLVLGAGYLAAYGVLTAADIAAVVRVIYAAALLGLTLWLHTRWLLLHAD